MLRAFVGRARATLVLLVAGGCSEVDRITEPLENSPQVLAARLPASGYVARQIGLLPGHVSNFAEGVNDFGEVVGISYPSSSQTPWHPHAFIDVGGTLTLLSAQGTAAAISDGTPRYIAGRDFHGASTRPVRWTFDPSTGGVTEQIIDVPGVAVDVNDAGLMIGSSNGNAVLWPLVGDPEIIAATSGFTRASGRGVNNANHVSVTFHGAASRGYLRVNGNLIELSPAPGHTMSFSGKVSEPVGGFVYVSGVSAANVETDYHLARWKVDVVNGALVSVEARPEVSEGRGVSDAGVVPGQIEERKVTAFVWSLSSVSKLSPTRGGTNPETTGMSANSRYITGSAAYALSRRALLWTLQ